MPAPSSRRARRLRIVSLAAGMAHLGVGACTPPPPGVDAQSPAAVAPASLLPVNWRSLAPEADGATGLVAVFDADKALRLTAVEAGAAGEAVLDDAVEADASSRPGVPPGARFELVVGGVVVPLVAQLRGPHVTLTPAPGAPRGRGTLTAVWAEGVTPQVWPVALRPGQDPRPEVSAALAACAAGRADDGLAALRTLAAAAPPAADHGHLVEEARCFQGAGRLDDALAAWRRAAEGAARAGLPTEQARRLRAAAFVAIQRRRFGEARALLDETGPLDAVPPPPWRNRAGEARTLYYRGLLEGELGNLRRAVADTRAAVARFEALGLADEARMAREWLVHQHQRAGSDREALDVLAGIESEDPAALRPAERARMLHNRAWFRAAAMQRGLLPRDDDAVRHAFEAARTLFVELGQTAAAAEADVNLAWMDLRAGAPGAARARLEALDRLPGGAATFSADFRRLLRGELALAEGDARAARAAFAESARLAREEAGGLDSEERWRALHGLGRAEARLGRRDRAAAAFGEALDALEAIGRRTLLRTVRAGFFDARYALVEDAIGLALADGDAARAFEVVLRSQARLLRELEASVRPARLTPEARRLWDERVEAWARARQTWEEGRAAGELLPARALPAWRAERERARRALTAAYEAAFAVLDQATAPSPEGPTGAAAVRSALGPDTVLLNYFRLGGRIHGLRVDAEGLRLFHPAGDDLLAGAKLEATLRRLYIVPGEVAAARALPVSGRVDGRPLAAFTAVSLLPHAGLVVAPRAESRSTAVLVVADPSGDLPVARREAERLRARHPAARVLLGREARRSEVLDAMRGAALFHFAGHGVTLPEDPWAAHLSLAAEQTLTLEDVLIARAPIRTVVLSGCETGAATPVGDRAGVGLAEAFLAAGARTVLATERVVGDAEAGGFVARFHEAGGADAPGAAWQAAMQTVPASGDAFRLFGALSSP